MLERSAFIPFRERCQTDRIPEPSDRVGGDRIVRDALETLWFEVVPWKGLQVVARVVVGAEEPSVTFGVMALAQHGEERRNTLRTG